MEKKKYITPECEVIGIELESHLLGLSFEEELGDGEVDENTSDDMGANRHRGEWGNLWSDWGR